MTNLPYLVLIELLVHQLHQLPIAIEVTAVSERSCIHLLSFNSVSQEQLQ